jgi:hypothetical protein
LKFIPDDKLTWSPSPTSKSALKIAAHVASSLHGMAGALSGKPMPDMNFNDFMAMMAAEDAKITTREQAVSALESGFAAVLSGLDKVTQEQMAGKITTPFGEIPADSFVLLPSLHTDCHASQLDYLQTTWGDMEMHMG